MHRVYNFSAGPAVLPEEVLKEAAADMFDYHGSGMSVMEMSHRSKWFSQIIEDAEANLRKLAGISEDYTVLFLQGGASQQFAAIPMNLSAPKNGIADYIVSGSWSKKAFKEAGRFVEANCLASSEETTFDHIPDPSSIQVSKNADYLYICENETIYGTHYHTLPETGAVPLVADMSSCFLSEPFDVSSYGLIYAGVQKNVGPAGVVIDIVRNDLIPTEDLPSVPTMLQFKTQADAKSLYNTPPCWGIYICGLVFEHLLENGGLTAMKERNEKKAQLLYDCIDASEMFHGTAAKEDRSIMNVPFVSGNADLDAKFVAEATEAGLVNLKGHRSVGGLRASIYNAMPYEGVQALVDFIEKFEAANK